MVPSFRVRLPLSATGDGARAVVGLRSLAAPWLSRSEEARPGTARGPAPDRAAIPSSSHHPPLLWRDRRQQDKGGGAGADLDRQDDLPLAVEPDPRRGLRAARRPDL